MSPSSGKEPSAAPSLVDEDDPEPRAEPTPPPPPPELNVCLTKSPRTLLDAPSDLRLDVHYASASKRPPPWQSRLSLFVRSNTANLILFVSHPLAPSCGFSLPPHSHSLGIPPPLRLFAPDSSLAPLTEPPLTSGFLPKPLFTQISPPPAESSLKPLPAASLHRRAPLTGSSPSVIPTFCTLLMQLRSLSFQSRLSLMLFLPFLSSGVSCLLPPDPFHPAHPRRGSSCLLSLNAQSRPHPPLTVLPRLLPFSAMRAIIQSLPVNGAAQASFSSNPPSCPAASASHVGAIRREAERTPSAGAGGRCKDPLAQSAQGAVIPQVGDCRDGSHCRTVGGGDCHPSE